MTYVCKQECLDFLMYMNILSGVKKYRDSSVEYKAKGDEAENDCTRIRHGDRSGTSGSAAEILAHNWWLLRWLAVNPNFSDRTKD